MTKESAGPVTDMSYAVLPERMPEIPQDKLNEEQRAVVAALVASRGGLKGSFKALVRSPQLMDRIQKLGAFVRFEASLDLRVNRVASLLTTRHWSNQYEWSGNTVLAREAGLSAEIINAIGEGRRPEQMAADEEAAYDFVTELLANKGVSDRTYTRAVEKFGEHGVIDMLGIVGYYGLLAMVMNAVRTPVVNGSPMPLAPMPQQLRPTL